MTEFRVGLPEGQKPLLDGPPCDCDRKLMNLLTEESTRAALLCVALCQGCCIGPAASLVLAAAGLVNPENVQDPFKESNRHAARVLADVMEQVARGIRLRANQ